MPLKLTIVKSYQNELKKGVVECIEKMYYCIFHRMTLSIILSSLQANGERRQQVPACDNSREMEEVLTCQSILYVQQGAYLLAGSQVVFVNKWDAGEKQTCV